MKKNFKIRSIRNKIAVLAAAGIFVFSAGAYSAEENVNTEEIAESEETEEETKRDVGAKADEIIDKEALIADEENNNESIYADSVKTEKAVHIIINNGEISAEKKDKKIKSDKLSDYGITIGEGVISLGKGTFILEGDYEGQIIIDAGKKKETILVLNNFNIKNTSDEAIICKDTGSLVIIAADGTENTVISGTECEITEESAGLTEESTGGAIHTRADTVISGRGVLSICGYINNGIQAAGNLTIDSGTLNISSVNNGIKVKDTFHCTGGEIDIKAGNDGIKAENEGIEAQEAVLDETTGEIITEAVEAEESKGTVIIDGGVISIDCYNDGIESFLNTSINGGFISIGASGTYYTDGSYTRTRNKTFSGKGVKAGNNLIVNGGTTVVKSYRDGFHCGEKLQINDGTVSIYCGDDGLHSDKDLEINGGIVNVSNSCEGIEANQIVINGGTVSLAAGDDGMNAYGGSGFGSGGNRSDTPKDMPNIIINGGDIYVKASGDGIDSNGNITVNGGKTVVDGPTSSMNGPLDGGTENGGQITITGGTVFAGGTSSMAETFNSKSLQPSIFMIGINYQTESEISVLDEAGNEIFSHTTNGSGSSIVFSSPELEIDHTYTVKINEDEYEAAVTGISTTVRITKKVK